MEENSTGRLKKYFVKVFNNKTYYWCINHQARTIHKPAECNLHASPPNHDFLSEEEEDSYLHIEQRSKGSDRGGRV